MKLKKVVRITFQVLIICLVIYIYAVYAKDMVTGERVIGGPCEYTQYKGHAKIVSITKINEHERYEVKFLFVPDQEIKESYAQTEGKEFLLMLRNFSYPGPQFLEKYGIGVGKVFDCYLKVIIKGTCTPMLFEFPSIRLDDYFEN
ncbi:MAG: hypothetical protein OEZ31_02750 [Nitrospirota bacterium]|nr:hypothetical protein [Nitrospirota bacterium]